jgi:nucleoside-diphosphate-sugar epimerase
MKILVTGAHGFLGSALVARLASQGVEVRACVRRQGISFPGGVGISRIEDIDADTDWGQALKAIGVVVHAAARVHVMDDKARDPLMEFRRVNVDGTLSLARQAAAAGVRRFVFVSSVKVNGETTAAGAPFLPDGTDLPTDPYGISKMEAELGLRAIALQTGMEVVVVRPPLVYGPGVKANFAALIHAVQRGWPLPFGALHNRRSLVALDNLLDLIVVCLMHPQAANQTFLVSDGHDLSVNELVRGLACALGVPARLVSIPVWIMKSVGAGVGKTAAVQRLTGNLQVDISKTKELLNWIPRVSVDEGLRRTVADLVKL